MPYDFEAKGEDGVARHLGAGRGLKQRFRDRPLRRPEVARHLGAGRGLKPLGLSVTAQMLPSLGI